MKYLLVLDFDNTITDWDDKLPKARADKIAKILEKMTKKYPIRLVLLSLANRAHILHTVAESGSDLLMSLLKNTLMITEENRTIFQKLNSFRQETQSQKNKTILQVMKDPKYKDDQDCIRAYKKTNSLKRLSSFNQVPPNRFFFLDDNWYNIRFAKNYGFGSYRVMNKIPSKTIFVFLDKIEKQLMKQRQK